MLIDINPNMELPKYTLTLCKLNTEPISILKNILDLNTDFYFANIDEISFDVPLYRTDTQGNKVRNEIYDLINGDMLVLLDKTDHVHLDSSDIKQYFYLDQVDEVDDGEGTLIKQVHGFSREYQLAQKKIPFYSGLSRTLYDDTYSIDENNLYIGALNFIESRTSWKVGYINPSLLTLGTNFIQRAINISNSNVLQFLLDLQSIFNCFFRYDTVNKLINVYTIEQFGADRGLYISDQNFISSLEKTIKSDEIKTRLYLFGAEGVSINAVNTTGLTYLENYDYYKNREFMSQNLIDALNDYETFVMSKTGEFEDMLDELEGLREDKLIISNEITDLNAELAVIRSDLDIAITNRSPNDAVGAEIAYIQGLEADKIAEIDIKVSEEAGYESQIADIELQMKTLQNSFNMAVFFNSSWPDLKEELLDELDTFIKEETFMDAAYTKNNVLELYNHGVQMLNRISQPAIQFTTNVVDFLDIVECQHVWKTFALGDTVSIAHHKMGIDYQVKLIGFKHQASSNSLELIFSNRYSIDDANIYLRDLLRDINITSATVSFNKAEWDKGPEAKLAFSLYTNKALELTKQQILTAENQHPILDERGFWGLKYNSLGALDPNQLRITNNAIALTQDSWATVDVALSAKYGINANLIRGKLGQFAVVQANQIVVGDGGVLSEAVLGGKVVKEDVLYNQVLISSDFGIQVKDASARERVRIGNYAPGKYGLVIKDATGTKTILDEDGILQTWQEGRTDNIDTGYPLKIYLFIPGTAKVINQVLLRFQRDYFRAYSVGAKFYQRSSWTSEDGGADVRTSREKAAVLETTGLTGGMGITSGSGVEVQYDYAWTKQADGHAHEYRWVEAHKHIFELPDHSHDFTIPPHRHEVEIDDHKHVLPDISHTHETIYGIYEHNVLPSDIRIAINGVNRTVELGGGAGFNTNQSSLNITNYVNKGMWNTIEISGQGKGRIDASVFVQALMVMS